MLLALAERTDAARTQPRIQDCPSSGMRASGVSDVAGAKCSSWCALRTVISSSSSSSSVGGSSSTGTPWQLHPFILSPTCRVICSGVKIRVSRCWLSRLGDEYYAASAHPRRCQLSDVPWPSTPPGHCNFSVLPSSSSSLSLDRRRENARWAAGCRGSAVCRRVSARLCAPDGRISLVNRWVTGHVSSVSETASSRRGGSEGNRELCLVLKSLSPAPSVSERIKFIGKNKI